MSRVPALAGGGPYRARRLPSLSNRVWLLDGPGASHVVRLAADAGAPSVDREAEAHNHGLAAGLGLAPPVVHAEPRSGLLVTTYLGEAGPLDPADLAWPDDGPADAALDALRRLHGSRAAFAGLVDLPVVLARYREGAASRARGHLAAWTPVVEAALAAAERLPPVFDGAAPCHHDPGPANVLVSGRTAWLVDWEHSGMGRPAWDVATLALEADLDDRATARLWRAYLQRLPSRGESAVLDIHLVCLDVVAALWALAGHLAAPAHHAAPDVDAQVAPDVDAYADRRLDRAERRRLAGMLDRAVDDLEATAGEGGR